MNVGIAGAGAIAMGYAALLLQNGHGAALWSPSGKRTEPLLGGASLKVAGAIEGTFGPDVCLSAEELARYDVIVLALPAYGQKFVIDSLLPHIEARHTVIISGHLSFAALYLAKGLAERGIQIPVAVWNTTALTSKARSPTDIKVGVLRPKVDIAVVPATLIDRALMTCTTLFGDRFVAKDDILTIALSNLNPQSHLGIALCNLTRIERGESWGQRSNITPSVGRLLEALDLERIAIAAAFAKAVRTVFEHYTLSFGIPEGSVADMSADLAACGKDVPGPTDTYTRYVLEDVPFGLVPTLYLARMAGIAAPLHQSGVDILSACYGRDLATDNDLLPELGLENIEALMQAVLNGYLTPDRSSPTSVGSISASGVL